VCARSWQPVKHNDLCYVGCAVLIACSCVFVAGQQHQVEHGGEHMEKQREANVIPPGQDEARLDVDVVLRLQRSVNCTRAVCWNHTWASGIHSCFHRVLVNAYALSTFGQGVVTVQHCTLLCTMEIMHLCRHHPMDKDGGHVCSHGRR
jgi:hypothetical protein